jgi:hypothetical protein
MKNQFGFLVKVVLLEFTCFGYISERIPKRVCVTFEPKVIFIFNFQYPIHGYRNPSKLPSRFSVRVIERLPSWLASATFLMEIQNQSPTFLINKRNT